MGSNGVIMGVFLIVFLTGWAIIDVNLLIVFMVWLIMSFAND